MPRFDILMKPTALPKSFAKDRGSEHRMVVDDYSKHEAVRQARNSASLSGLYLARLHKLKQAVNTETGEITAGDQDDDALRQVEQGGASADPVMTYASVADKLQKAANEDQLAEAADLIQYVGSITQRDELSGIYKRKAAEFKAQ